MLVRREGNGRKERERERGGGEGEKKEGQSGSGNDRPSALEANIDECPALLALRNRGNVESLSFCCDSVARFFLEALPRTIGAKTATCAYICCANSNDGLKCTDDAWFVDFSTWET